MIAEYLSEGKKNAITAKELAKIIGCTVREVSQRVELERRAGVPICASCDPSSPGYYLPENAGELALYVAALNKRLRNIRRTSSSMESILFQMTDQETISGWHEMTGGQEEELYGII